MTLCCFDLPPADLFSKGPSRTASPLGRPCAKIVELIIGELKLAFLFQN